MSNAGLFGFPKGLGLVNGLYGFPKPSTNGLWTPSVIQSTLWLDASDASSIILVSGAVSQWNDKSGNSNHATQSVSVARPTVATASLNGLDTVAFDNSNDGMITSANLTRDYEIFLVAKQVASGNRRIIQSRDINAVIAFRRSTNNIFIVTSIYNPAYSTVNTFAQMSLSVSNSTNSFAYLSDSDLGNSATSANWGRVALGAAGTAAEPADGSIAELLCLPYISTLDIRQRIQGFFAHKWGLTDALAIMHPYKNNPPYL